MATPNLNDQHVTYWSEISRFLKKQYKFNWNKKKKFHKVLKGNLSFFCCCQVAVKLARQFWRFHVFFWVKTWNPRWFHWNRGPSCDGFIETGGRRPSCFNEYNRSVSSLIPKITWKAAKIVARVSLNTWQKKNIRVFHLKPCFSDFWPNFTSEYHPVIFHFIPCTGENS